MHGGPAGGSGRGAGDGDAGKSGSRQSGKGTQEADSILQQCFQALNFPGGIGGSVASDLLCLHRKRLVTREAQRK